MRVRPSYRLPEDKERKLKRAGRLEWATIFFMITIILVIYLTMGSSQAMKAAWIEDILSLVPPIAFLVAMRIRNRPPNEEFPYGYSRAINIAFLCAAVALTMFGLFIFFDSAMKLVNMEHPTIGTVQIFGWRLWMGWLMIAALIYSAIPPVILGRMKLPLARELHEKTLRTDADMNKADWLTAVAAIIGILGIGIGWWWLDPIAALIISLDILKDGFTSLKNVTEDLMDRRPVKVESREPDEVPDKIRHALEQLNWVKAADVRLREEGHVFTGEAYVVPKDENNIINKLKEASRVAESVDWRVYDIVVTAVDSLEDSRKD
ncbi:MAG TPA: cation diffusion facilitator family transporter [Thermodesulfobacteriota bacterium]|nr:cation diffusion facilitator family transporter [Thermodesulfobacteriota bacterium]